MNVVMRILQGWVSSGLPAGASTATPAPTVAFGGPIAIDSVSDVQAFTVDASRKTLELWADVDYQVRLSEAATTYVTLKAFQVFGRDQATGSGWSYWIRADTSSGNFYKTETH